MPLFFNPVVETSVEEKERQRDRRAKSWLTLSIRGSELETFRFLIGYIDANLVGYERYYAQQKFRYDVYYNYIKGITSVLENCNVSCFFTYLPVELAIPLEEIFEDAIDYLETALLIEQVKEAYRKNLYGEVSTAQGS